MSTAMVNGSAYPASVDELLPRARTLAQVLEAVPSRNRLMSEFRIGAPKAQTLRDSLAQAYADVCPAPCLYPEPIGPDPAPEPVTGSEAAPGVPAGSTSAAGAAPVAPASAGPALVTVAGHPAEPAPAEPTPAAPVDQPEPDAERRRIGRRIRPWPVWLLALPAFVAVWSGWVGLGGLTGFGLVNLLPGIVDNGGWATLDTSILLPIGVETYGAYALRVWMSGAVPARARTFARRSAIGSLTLGAVGQVAYHLMTELGVTHAPWWITTLVACLPVAVLGMGAALAHLLHDDE